MFDINKSIFHFHGLSLVLWPFQVGDTYNLTNLIEDGIRAI